MKNKRLLDIIGEIDDKHIAEAAPTAKKSRKTVWMKWGATVACLALVVIAAAMILYNPEQPVVTPADNSGSAITAPDNPSGTVMENSSNDNSCNDNQSPSNENPIDIWNSNTSGRVDASYDRGYKSVEELLEVTTLIVRATPIAVEAESPLAVCWVLCVEESDKEGVEVIRLRQLKDEHLLQVGREVVLALQEDVGDGSYYIPGGGCGLFRIDEATGTVNGMMSESLKEHSPADAELTLSDVFDILTDMSNK